MSFLTSQASWVLVWIYFLTGRQDFEVAAFSEKKGFISILNMIIKGSKCIFLISNIFMYMNCIERKKNNIYIAKLAKIYYLFL